MLPERIVVDATALISASLKGRALRIFLDAPIREFLTCSFTLSEASDYLPKICERIRRVPLLEAEMILSTLPVSIFDRDHFRSQLGAAEKLMCEKDRKDVELLALALHEGIPIWTEDSDFKSREIKKVVKSYTTGEIFSLWEKMG